MGVVLQVNEALKEFQKAVDSKIWESAFRITANEIAKQAFTKTRKAITEKYNISFKKFSENHYAFKSKQTGEIKKRSGHLYIVPAYRDKNSIEIKVIGDGIPLILFPHKYSVMRHKTGKVVRLTKRTKLNPKDKKVLSVKIVKGKETILKSAFIAKMPSGHTGIFVRESKERLPILEKKSVSVRHMFKTAKWEGVKGFENILQKIWNEKAEAKMFHKLNWKLKSKMEKKWPD